jgi:3D (Asp-Asp-Asp) domain-containing protein
MLPFFLLITALLVLLAIDLVRHDVILAVDGRSRVMTTFSDSVAELLDEADITLSEADKLSHAPDEKIRNGMTIEVKTAFPVSVYADDDVQAALVAEATVGEVLEQVGITLGPLDRIEPAVFYPVEPGTDIKVTRVARFLTTERTRIPYREIRRGNPSLDQGETRILQRGVTGLREDTVEVTMENGIEVSAKVLHSEVIRVRQDSVVEYGENTYLSRSGRTLNFTRVFQMAATSYCAGTEESGCPTKNGRSVCTGKNNDGITASGLRAIAGSGRENTPHMVAVDPRVIPLGSRLFIDGYGFAVAVDTGSAIKGNRIDLLLGSHDAARRFGRKRLRVYLLPK